MLGTPFHQPNPNGGHMRDNTHIKTPDGETSQEPEALSKVDRFKYLEHLEGKAFAEEAREIIGSEYWNIAEKLDHSKEALLEEARKALGIGSPAEIEWEEAYKNSARVRLNYTPDADPGEVAKPVDDENAEGPLH